MASMKGGHFLTVICSFCRTALNAFRGIALNQSGSPCTAGNGGGSMLSSSGGHRNVMVTASAWAMVAPTEMKRCGCDLDGEYSPALRRRYTVFTRHTRAAHDCFDPPAGHPRCAAAGVATGARCRLSRIVVGALDRVAVELGEGHERHDPAFIDVGARDGQRAVRCFLLHHLEQLLAT